MTPVFRSEEKYNPSFMRSHKGKHIQHWLGMLNGKWREDKATEERAIRGGEEISEGSTNERGGK